MTHSFLFILIKNFHLSCDRRCPVFHDVLTARPNFHQSKKCQTLFRCYTVSRCRIKLVATLKIRLLAAFHKKTANDSITQSFNNRMQTLNWRDLSSRTEYVVKTSVFWVVAPCGLAEIDRRFRRVALLMEAVNASETSVNFCKTTTIRATTIKKTDNFRLSAARTWDLTLYTAWKLGTKTNKAEYD